MSTAPPPTWAGPLEHITAESWPAADRWFPGLQLETLAAGGANDLSVERALLLARMYATLVVAAGLLTLSRRDISGRTCSAPGGDLSPHGGRSSVMDLCP